MSSVRLSGNVGGTGVFTVTSPNSNNSPTMTLPDATTTLVGTDATQSFTNKSFDSASVPTVSGTAPLYFARTWVNFNGSGTVAIRASGNVTSITDNGTGDFTVNFTTAMPDTNYAVFTSTDNSITNTPVSYRDQTSADSTTSVRVGFANSAATRVDNIRCYVSVFR